MALGTSFLVVLLLVVFPASISCQELSRVSQLWRQMYSPQEVLKDIETVLMDDLGELLAHVDEKANVPTNLTNCIEDLLILGGSKQMVKMIGRTKFNMSALALAIDAAGKPAAGLLQGASVLRGNMEECQLITVPMNHSKEMFYAYLSVSISNMTTHAPVFPAISEELCLPSSCDPVAVYYLLSHLNNTLHTRGICFDSKSSFYSLSMKGQALTTQAIVMITLCSIICALVVVSTLADVLSPVISDWIEERRRLSLSHFIKDDSDGDLSDSDPLLGNLNSRGSRSNKCVTLLHELMTVFSLYKNIPMILSTRQPPSAITSINGVRVISMFWVIMCHVFFILSLDLRNMAYLAGDVMPRFISQVIINGFLSVDSFFFLSGVLVSYLTLREMKRRKGKFPVVPYYLHRFLRLTPTYMFILFFYWFISMYLGQSTPNVQVGLGPSSPTWKSCEQYWWTNLLYINNLYPDKINDECMSWSWYLANDMQFFVISPLIIIPLYVWFTGGLIASSFLLLVSFAVTAFVTGFFNLPASQFLPLVYGQITPPDAPAYSDVIYIKPYCRIGPYIVGLVLGAMFYYEYKPKLSKLANWMIYLSLWLASIAIGISAVYGLYGGFQGRVLTGAENILYNMLARSGWGVALAIVLFACHHGYGGPINSFLSMPFWIPLSRLTYTAYLMHPIVLFAIVSSERDTFYYTDVTIAVYIAGTTVLSYGAAALVSTFVEFPVANIEMAVFKALGISLRESSRRVNTNKTEIYNRSQSSPLLGAVAVNGDRKMQ